jgi:hypothetical protein
VAQGTTWSVFHFFEFLSNDDGQCLKFSLKRDGKWEQGETVCCPFFLCTPGVRAVVSWPSSTVGQCKPCGDKRCKCCLQLQHTQVFHSKTTGKEYKIFCNVNCKTPNVVYLLDSLSVFDFLSNLDCGQWYTFWICQSHQMSAPATQSVDSLARASFSEGHFCVQVQYEPSALTFVKRWHMCIILEHEILLIILPHMCRHSRV